MDFKENLAISRRWHSKEVDNPPNPPLFPPSPRGKSKLWSLRKNGNLLHFPGGLKTSQISKSGAGRALTPSQELQSRPFPLFAPFPWDFPVIPGDCGSAGMGNHNFDNPFPALPSGNESLKTLGCSRSRDSELGFGKREFWLGFPFFPGFEGESGISLPLLVKSQPELARS